MTFDDGYADNYQAATDILTPLGISGVFYVTVGCIDKQRLPWPSLLRYAFLTSKRGSWAEIEGSVWTLSSTQERIRAFDRASEHCSSCQGPIRMSSSSRYRSSWGPNLRDPCSG